MNAATKVLELALEQVGDTFYKKRNDEIRSAIAVLRDWPRWEGLVSAAKEIPAPEVTLGVLQAILLQHYHPGGTDKYSRAINRALALLAAIPEAPDA